MFEGLDDIDWSSLTHAYGSAADVPGLLRARASHDPAVAEEAGSEFFGNIWHQGTVYEATAYAVPYLVRLLMRKETHDRFDLVVLLASIAEGNSYVEVHAHFMDYMNKPELDAKLARELRWKAEARAAVQARADDYWRLMDDPDVRITIPYLLAKLPGEAARICQAAPLFTGSQNDALYRASMLVSWAMCLPAGEDEAGPFVALMQNAETPLLQLCAALGVLRVCGRAHVDEALRVYFDALRDESPYAPNDTRWFWGEGEFSFLLLKWIPNFGSAAKEAASLWLPSTLPHLEDYTAMILASEAMPWAFTADGFPRSRGELTALQLSLLQALARCTNVLQQDPLIESILKALGVPNDMKRLKAFLE